jgi:hypothetical protein
MQGGDTPCPTCSGPIRETTNLVCQTCGRDYSKEVAMPKLPKKAVLDLNAEKFYIDGEEFPWYITEAGVQVDGLLDRNAIPTLTFTMFAETVEVIPKESLEG